MSSDDELNYVMAAAREAGEAVLGYFSSGNLGTRPKGKRDVVTLADATSERILTRRLQEAFPEDGIVGEEGTSVRESGRRRWYLDPLDGTLNFSRFVPLWCVSVSLFVDQVPELGVIYDPIRQEMFSAVSTSGACCNGEPIGTSEVTNLADALVHVTVDFIDGSISAGLHDLQALSPRALRTRNTGSAALALAWVAAGRLDAMLHRYAHPWDYGAGVVLIESAGGRVTDPLGAPYHLGARAIVASNGKIQDELLAAMQSAPA